MLKVLLNIHFFCCICLNCQSQDKLNNPFDYLATTIKDAYAGYHDKVKGGEFDALVRRVKRSNSKDTFALLSQITAFFKDHHLLLFDFNISKQRIDTIACKKDSQMVQNYFANKKHKYEYEGYWLNDRNHCVIALKRIKSNPITYYGYIVESKAKAIPGYCILKMTQQKDGSYFTDYISENFGYKLFLHARFKNKNTLWVNSFGGKWLRQPDYQPGVLKKLTTFSYKPALVVIDDKTLLLRMNDFGGYNIKKIDSIIKANETIIRQATTLILDIRNNTGGTILNYFPLFPYIYTNPILHCGYYVRYSNTYIADRESKAKVFSQKGDTSKAREYQASADTMKAKKGQFVFFEADTLAKGLPILSNPKNIAIVMNNNCLSAAELMILNFKQSKKVKLFGERTGGAVDYLDALTIPIASERYSLFIAISKRALTTSQPSYDGTGIKPDVEISDSVSDWVAFVTKDYNEK